MRNQLKNKNTWMIILVVIIAFLLIFLYITFENKNVLEKKELYAKVVVGEKYGFDINSTALTFGMIIPGLSSASRQIVLTNNYNRDVNVKVYTDGNISEFLKISENNFILENNASRNLSFSVSVPTECNFGTYDGKVTILIKGVSK